MSRAESRVISLQIPDKARADWGRNVSAEWPNDPRMEWYRDVMVDPDGTIRVWDEIAEHYTRLHNLTEAEVVEARRLAGVAS